MKFFLSHSIAAKLCPLVHCGMTEMVCNDSGLDESNNVWMGHDSGHRDFGKNVICGFPPMEGRVHYEAMGLWWIFS